MTAQATKILCVGAGAIGSFYSSRLSQLARVSLDFICRSNYQAIKANGLFITSPKYGKSHFMPRNVFRDPEEARKSRENWDYIIMATKALPEISDDSKILEGLVSDNTAILLLQNGLGIEQPYSDRFPKSMILSAVTIASVSQPSPGQIVHNTYTKLSVGPWLPGVDQSSPEAKKAYDRAVQFKSLLRESGVEDAEAYDHINLQMIRWSKLAINASMNASAVLSNGSDNGTLTTDPELAEHLKGVMNEIHETAPKVLGQPFPKGFPTPDQILRSTSKYAARSKASMLLDWEASKPIEIEVILGNAIRIARSKGLEMPRIQTMYALLNKASTNRKLQQADNENRAKGSKI